MKAFTDYPFTELGDEAYKLAPVREVEVVSYDGNKYCKIIVEGVECEVKAGYLYKNNARYESAKFFSWGEFEALPETKY